MQAQGVGRLFFCGRDVAHIPVAVEPPVVGVAALSSLPCCIAAIMLRGF